MKDNILKRTLQKNPWINRAVILYKEREKHLSWGEENPDQTFFVIRRNAPNAGLYSFVLTNLGWIGYALKKGYIPVVDMQNIYNTYLTKEIVGKVNAWEYYFRQPCGYTLEDIAHSKNIILSSVNAPEKGPMTGVEKRPQEWEMWQKLGVQYLQPSAAVKEKTKEAQAALFQGKRVLGVLCRGTDYLSKCPSGHPVQPAVEEIMEKAQEMMERLHCPVLYLATEDAAALRAFQNRFGEKLLTYGQQRYEDTGEKYINEMTDEMDAGAADPVKAQYQKGLDYAVTIALLAGCNALAAGRVSGAYGAVLQSASFEEVYLYDLGLYP